MAGKAVASKSKAGKGKGKGKSGGKMAAQRKKMHASKPVLEGITKGDIRRLARKGGVKRIALDVYGESRDTIRGFLSHLVKTSLVYTAAAKRKTCRPMDVVMAMKREGRSLYGFA